MSQKQQYLSLINPPEPHLEQRSTTSRWFADSMSIGSAVTHGFLLNFGTLTKLDFPATGITSTMALGLNDKVQVVGVYMVGTAMHGFVYNSTNGHFHSVDDPKVVGSTTINGINNFGQIVGFYVDSNGHTDGFIGTPL